MLAFDRHTSRDQLGEVVVAHAIGCAAGFLGRTVVDPQLVLTATPQPFSADGLRLIVSAILSIILTTRGMLAVGTIHPPACATTLIVSLGLLSTVVQVSMILLSVICIVVFHVAVLSAFKWVVGVCTRLVRCQRSPAIDRKTARQATIPRTSEPYPG